MKRRLFTAALLLALPAFASAQDEKVLSGSATDDIAFARALTENGYPDLAERLLVIVEKKGGGGAEAAAAIRAVKLEVAQSNAAKIEDPVQRKDALIKVLNDKLKFLDEAKATTAAEEMRHLLPDLYNAIGESISAAIKKETSEAKLGELRKQGDGIFQQAEQSARDRIEALKQIDPRTDDVEYQIQTARYNYCRMLYFHALLFPPGSGQRADLCNKAIGEYQEFDLDYNDSIFNYYGYIDTGNCYKELDKFDDAESMFDSAIKVREFWGEPVKGVYQVPGEIVDLVCYAMLQKMVLFREQKQAAKIVPVGKEYFATLPSPWSCSQSMALAKELAEAQLATSDLKGAAETAKSMIDVDPNGLGGWWGRDIPDRSGEGSFSDKLKTAEGKIAMNDLDGGIALCRQVMEDTKGTEHEAEGGCEALLLLGSAYQRRGWVEEASLAYQTAVDRFPKASGAAEALGRAIECYSSAQRTGRRKYYREHIDEGMNRLIRDYPKDPRASSIQMFKAKQLESEGDFLAAIDIYKSVQPSSDQYTKALLMIGIDYFNHALSVAQEKRSELQAKGVDDEQARKQADAESKPFFPLAESAFKSAINAVGAARGKTLDPNIIKAYDEQEYLATMSLAKLYMLPAFDKIAAAAPVIDSLEKTWAKDSAKGPEIQNLRGRVFLDQGKYDEAEKWVEDLYKRDATAAAGPAGQLARALDRQGQAKRTAKPNSSEGNDLWKRAARYYYISVLPQITGVASQRADELSEVGDRLFVYGLVFNGVPDTRQNFVDWTGTLSAPDYFVKASEIYKASLEQNPDYRMAISLGRAYGFLKRWVDSAAVYSRLFSQEPLLNPKDKRKLDPAMMRAKPDLISAYVEWGVAERMAFTVDGDKDRLIRCRDVIFAPLANTLSPETYAELYWATRYHFVKTLMDRGEYRDAKLSCDDIQRQVSPTFDDDKFGYKSLFEKAIAELDEKLR